MLPVTPHRFVSVGVEPVAQGTAPAVWAPDAWRRKMP